MKHKKVKLFIPILISTLISVCVIFGGLFFLLKNQASKADIFCEKPHENFWKIQSIDTMKQSRDLAREKLFDESFDKEIDEQVLNISKVGATHIAIATPYDKEFLPFLKRWIKSARKNNLNVWFRGNWSGWEGWFGYSKKLTRKKHIEKTVSFIINNPDLFRDGDVFSPCPECENGYIGDPRQTKRVNEFRKFVIDEYNASKKAFSKINKNVIISFPFNGDVAKLVMDKKTTDALGGYVTIDHYVKSTDKTVLDIRNLAKKSGGNIILGEFGAPIPGIHGGFSEKEQAKWVGDLMQKLSQTKGLSGVNYWVNIGGSTSIWNKNGTDRKAVSILKNAFNPYVVYGQVVDEFGRPVKNAKIVFQNKNVNSDETGCFATKFISDNDVEIFGSVFANGFQEKNLILSEKITQKNIKLIKKDKDWKFIFKLWLKNKINNHIGLFLLNF